MPLPSSTAVLASILLLIPAASGCAFANSGMALPAGHHQVGDDELSQTCTIANCYYSDPTNTSLSNHQPNCTAPGTPNQCSAFSGLKNTPGFASTLDALAAFHQTELCYWAWQSLPPPEDQEGNWELKDDDVDAIFRLGTMANDRYHSLIGNNVMAGGLSTSGTLLTKNLCDRGILDGDRCDDKILNQAMPVPAAIQIVRVAEGTAEDVLANITDWRESPSLHLPNIEWAVNDSGGWGYAGELRFKVVRCDDIPEAMLGGTKDLTADPLVDGESMHDAMLSLWQSLDSLCPPEQWVVGENSTGCVPPSS